MITEIGFALVQNLVQMIIGTLLATVIYILLHKKVDKYKKNQGREIIYIVISSLIGAVVPLETYGVLPIVMVLLQIGFSAYVVLPLLLSNTLFNMLIPFNDPSFVWRSGYMRLVVGVLLGMVAGLVIQALHSRKEVVVLKPLAVKLESPIHTQSLFKSIHNNITVMGVYLILGVILNVLFNEYVLYNVTEAVFSYSKTAYITRFFGSYNIVHPLFLLGVNIIYALMNFTMLSGLLVIIKLKSVLMYVLYCGVWSILLGCSMFLK